VCSARDGARSDLSLSLPSSLLSLNVRSPGVCGLREGAPHVDIRWTPLLRSTFNLPERGDRCTLKATTGGMTTSDGACG
jgi:hypothetical protein